jgi:glycosyltransferase involved in cell wall biosynthesis
MDRPLVFCLTPVRNEAWILERFLACASLWADRIIIADQGSTDGSRAIAQAFPKVTLLDNSSSQEWSEPVRQQMLLAEARRTPGPKILFALDADEFLTANFLTSREWDTALSAPPGTAIGIQWPEIKVGLSDLSYFYYPTILPIGFVDDGSEHKPELIHGPRLPIAAGSKMLALTEIKLMHYCLVDLDRATSKARWYQCFEHLARKKKPIDLYRFYYKIQFVPEQAAPKVPREWIEGYEARGIDMSSVNRDGSYRWDREVLEYFKQYGAKKFRRLKIWDVDWTRLRDDLYPEESANGPLDPRSKFDKLVHRWLESTQPDFSLYATPPRHRMFFNKCVQKVLGSLGW